MLPTRKISVQNVISIIKIMFCVLHVLMFFLTYGLVVVFNSNLNSVKSKGLDWVLWILLTVSHIHLRTEGWRVEAWYRRDNENVGLPMKYIVCREMSIGRLLKRPLQILVEEFPTEYLTSTPGNCGSHQKMKKRTAKKPQETWKTKSNVVSRNRGKEKKTLGKT